MDNPFKNLSNGGKIAVAAGGVVVIYYAYRQHKNAQASTSSTSPSSIDPVTGLPYSQDTQIDPLTGMAYLAEAQQYGSVSAAESAVAGQSAIDYSSAYGSSYGPVGTSSTGSTVLGTTGSGGYASNAAWAQAVTAGLTAIGYTSTDVSAALGMYLGSLPLSTLADGVSAASIVQAAVAEYGPPPVGSYVMIPATPSGQTSTGSGNTGTGTSDTGSYTGTTSTGTTSTGTTSTAPAPSHWSYPAPTNLQAGSGGKGRINVSWNPVVGPQGQRPNTYTIAYGRTSGAQTWKVTTPGTSTQLTTQDGMTEYIEVWANGGPIAPPHAGPVKATAGK